MVRIEECRNLFRVKEFGEVCADLLVVDENWMTAKESGAAGV